MLRGAILAYVTLLLSGCLSTPQPVFDQTNSRPLSEIPEFAAFVDAWEGFSGDQDSPRELIAEGARGIVVDGILVVQERNEYFAVAVVSGRPLACVINADRTIHEVAASHGVSVELDEPEIGEIDSLSPVPVKADGPAEGLLAFIRDQFANQALACSMPKRGG